MSDQKKKILLIEDDLYSRDLFIETLTGAGYDVVAAVDGIEGFTKLQDGASFDLILLDAMMPRMDGLTFLTKLRASTFPAKENPVVILTNLAGDGMLKHALESGAKACLIKTDLNPDQLVQKIREFLQ